MHGTNHGKTRIAWLLLLPAALILEGSYVWLRLAGDIREHLVESVGLYLLTSLFYLVSCWIALRNGTSGGRARWTVFIAGWAIVFRVTVWGLAPGFSDDVYRYRWEGKMQAHGGNPYQAAPSDPEWAHLRDETFERVASPDARAGYGPLMELLQLGVYRLVERGTADPYRQAFWFKAPAALFDLAVLAALAGLIALKRLPPERLILYAWSPLVVLEFWTSGHNDALVLLVIMGALWAAERGRWLASFTALSVATAAKIWPLLLFPIFAGWKRWGPARRWQWSVLAPVALAAFLPYWSDIYSNARYMTGFVGGWRNNDSLYGVLLWLTGDRSTAKYAAFAIIGVTVLVLVLKRVPIERASLIAIAVTLLVSANCHPWYLTWLVPFLVFVPSIGLLLWTALAPLSYEVVIRYTILGEWDGVTPMRWLIYGPVFGVLAYEIARAHLRRGGKPQCYPEGR